MTSAVSYLWEDNRLIPLYGAGLSALHLAVHAIRVNLTRDASKATPGPDPEGRRTDQNVFRRLVERAGGSDMAALKITRVVCTLLLVALSLGTILPRQTVPYTDKSPQWIQYIELGVYVRSFPTPCDRN